MNTELAFLCDSATDDRGKLHALGIGIDSVQGDSLPMTHPRFIIVCVVEYSAAEAGEKRMAIRLLDPDARDTIPPIEQGITFSPREGVVDAKARIIVEVNSVTFNTAGPHAFHVVIDGSEMARLPLNVSQRSG
ncbi:MAG: hypothetical protein OXI54_06105 [Chloroflexota bacterium]|nr:hypothetical protein [Chloroflexota bacterium]MDE2683707.1 hypothetical protein [Chloroflexota bacterium]